MLVANATAAAINGLEGAMLLEFVVSEATLPNFVERLRLAHTWLARGENPIAAEVARQLGNGVAALDSVVTAIYVSQRLRGQSFVEMMRFVIACRGDTDTIGAMASAIWGAANGYSQIPEAWLLKLEQRERILKLADALSQCLNKDSP